MTARKKQGYSLGTEGSDEVAYTKPKIILSDKEFGKY
jgi:hypothetical protein